MGVAYVKGRRKPYRAILKGNHLGMFSTQEEAEKAVWIEEQRLAEETAMAEAASKPERKPKYKGLPIVESRAEFRGMEGGFNRGARVQDVPTEPLEDVFFAGKGRPVGERYDFVVKDPKSEEWRRVKDDDPKAEGVIFVRIYKTLGCGLADAELVGEAVHVVMERAAVAEAERRGRQGSFGIVVDINAKDEPPAEADPLAHIFQSPGEVMSDVDESEKGYTRSRLLDEEGASE